MGELVVVRHGQTEWSTSGQHTGLTDLPLLPGGEDDARRLRPVLGERQITSGALFVNAVVASDPRLPFGGTKRSGYGRELGEAGALEFTNARTYVVGGGVPAGPATE